MKDEWLRAAFSDDHLVAHLLLRLKDSPPPSPPHHHHTNHHTILIKCLPLPPSWGVRLPRSKPSTYTTTSSPPPQQQPPPPLPPPPPPPSFDSKTRGSETHRRSPTTPLSWTPSDESLSSHHPPPPSDRFRSKVSASIETPTTATGKRPRRKKTFAELKEEENSLLKERMHLKKELATMRQSVKEQRSINENLKRIKLDLHLESRIKSETNSVDERNNTSNGVSEAASSSVPSLDASEPDSHKEQATSQDQPFVLPDLNMVPEEDTVGTS